MVVDDGVFARLVGRYPDQDVLLFQVSAGVAWSEEWSPLVRFRFVRREGALAELEVATIYDPARDALTPPEDGQPYE